MNENDKDWNAPEFGRIYFALALADATTEGDGIGNWLNRNGFCNLTVCPTCHTDDFVHVEGCSMAETIEMIGKSAAPAFFKYPRLL